LLFFAAGSTSGKSSSPLVTMLMNIPTSIVTLSATHLQGLAFLPKSSHRCSAKLTASAQLNPKVGEGKSAFEALSLSGKE
jgi:hypothetical protein